MKNLTKMKKRKRIMKILENSTHKVCKSKYYNFVFDKKTGEFARWGETKEDDPDMSPIGCEILDLEISSGGDCKGRCPWCYKNNGVEGDDTHNMTFDEFKIIFHKLPKTLTQIAFGIMDIGTNPDFFKMMRYARQNGVIPNYTCHGLDMTPEYAKETAELCGAVAVSLVNTEKTYDTIKMLSIDNNMDQINCHYMLSEETYDRAFEIIDDITTDPRLEKFNAIVFLQYKSKGRNPDGFNSVLDVEKYKKLTEYCDEKKVRYGFDSCSAPIYTASIQERENKEQLEMYVEPCESGLFSSYLNYKGEFFVCSFAEGEDNWKEGLDVLHCDNFLKDIWYHPRLMKWRERLLSGDRNCPIYDLSLETV
jgi:MoaA/NifB/PqqE/SkfB family radical SAM enzyme